MKDLRQKKYWMIIKKYCKISLFTIIIALTSSCSEKPTYENIFDPESSNSPEAPQNIYYNISELGKIELIWSDEYNNETGFRIDKKEDIENWTENYEILAPNITSWIDLNAGLNNTLQYRVCVVFGDNNSDFAETQLINNIIPIPTNIDFERLTINSIEVTWEDNSNGEEGFKIDKKIGITQWQVEYTTVDENLEEWIDFSAEINEEIQYRIYSYSGNNQSDYLETVVIDNSLPIPTNMSFMWDVDEVTLNWQYSLSGIEQYIVSRKVGDNNWDNNYSEVLGSILEWSEMIDIDNEYTYRLRAKYDNYYSDYSNEICTTATDINGNMYKIVKIADQEWLVENLQVTHYRNSDPISYLPVWSDWTDANSGAYCIYDNSSSNIESYGNLYNWYAVNDSREIAPAGWHVATFNELGVLMDYLNGSSIAGGKLKEAGTSHWNYPNAGATNEYGYTALPGGYRESDLGYYLDIGNYGYFWFNDPYMNSFKLHYNYPHVAFYSGSSKRTGFSVRCVRD